MSVIFLRRVGKLLENAKSWVGVDTYTSREQHEKNIKPKSCVTEWKPENPRGMSKFFGALRSGGKTNREIEIFSINSLYFSFALLVS